MKNEEKKICRQCQKKFSLKQNITWIFGNFCSRKCEDDRLTHWLENQLQETKKVVVKKKSQ